MTTLMPSPTGGLGSAFSPYTDSPNSPAPYGATLGVHSNRSSGPSDSLAPPPSPYPQQIEPSPVDSNGTEGTEIEEEAQDDAQVKSPLYNAERELVSPDVEITSPQSANSDRVSKLDTNISSRLRSDSAENVPQSVIHIPSGFKDFSETDLNQTSPTETSDTTVRSPEPVEFTATPGGRQKPPDVSPVNTDIPRVNDRATPMAQTRQELEDEWKRRSRRTSSLEDIPEALDKDDDDDTDDGPSTAGLVGQGKMGETMQDSLASAGEEVAALRTALSECWTLCNTLAGLSSSHRIRTFKFAGKPEVQEQAWRSCWRLCQNLYESRDQDHAAQTIPTLELCRDFCQSLFEARQKIDEASDSVLRVSFELNNHLYNTHDRGLPEAFNERTLDFYITLCHRLMKQRTSLPQETDSLLRACWSLAEMLFNVRQSNREGKNPDEELLGSAVQACWELCDLFREGWTQIRPERGTPRPSQTTFSQKSLSSHRSTSSRSDNRSTSSLSNRQYHDAQAGPPETPTTIFDDTTDSAASSPESISIPNILVLGPASNGSGSIRGGSHHDRWSSNASVLSGYSESSSSQRTSSTATAGSEETHLTRLRYLVLKVGIDTGFPRSSGQTLPPYVKSLPSNAFGGLPWQMKVLELYKKLVTHDKSLMNVHNLPSRRLGALEVSKSIKWLGASEQWAWMRDLYRLVFGFGVDEADRRGGSIQV